MKEIVEITINEKLLKLTYDQYIKFKIDGICGVFLKDDISVSEEKLNEILHFFEYDNAVNLVYKYNNLRLHSKFEIKQYLYKKKIDKNIIDKIILDDQEFSNMFFEYLVSQNKYSYSQIKQKFYEKRVEKKVYEKLISDFNLLDSEYEFNIIKKFISKNENLEKQKLINKLGGKGFKYSDIKNALAV